jgi:hypothetical protein
LASVYDDSSRFDDLSELLREDAKFKPEWLARWHFENVWHHLMLLEFDDAERVLRAWPVQETLCFWEGKRAALFAELGYIDEAKKIAESALDRTRRARDQVSEDVGSLAREGWLMRLLQVLQRSAGGPQLVQPFGSAAVGARLNELARYRADPLVDLESRAGKVQAPDTRGRSEKTGFDPWSVVQTINFGSWHSAE